MGEITKNLQKARKQAGYTQKELADMLGVSTQTVYRWERGERTPTIKRLHEIATALNISNSNLLEGATDMAHKVIEETPSENWADYWSDFLVNIRTIINNGKPSDIVMMKTFIDAANGLLATSPYATTIIKNHVNSVSGGNNVFK